MKESLTLVEKPVEAITRYGAFCNLCGPLKLDMDRESAHNLAFLHQEQGKPVQHSVTVYDYQVTVQKHD